MKITAITQDQLIIVDGNAANMNEIGGFQMRRGEWAVQFDTLTGIGSVEYLDARPNQTLTQSEFDASYAWLIEEHARFTEWQQAQAAAQEEADAKAFEEQAQHETDTSIDGAGAASSTN